MLQPKLPSARAGKLAGRLKTLLAASLAFGVILLLLLLPDEGMKGAADGLPLCAEVVIPSLFPFLAVSAFVINIGLAEKIGRGLGPRKQRQITRPSSTAAEQGHRGGGGGPSGATPWAPRPPRASAKRGR